MADNTTKNGKDQSQAFAKTESVPADKTSTEKTQHAHDREADKPEQKQAQRPQDTRGGASKI